MNIGALRQQNHYDSLRELNKTSKILKEIYYEKEQIFGGQYNYFDIGTYLEEYNMWMGKIWCEKDLYVYSILNQNRDELFNGTYIEIVKAFKLKKNLYKGILYLTAFKVKEPEVGPAYIVLGMPLLHSDLSYI